MKLINDNGGGIDLQAVVVAIVGFSTVWIVWTTMSPVINELSEVATGGMIDLPDKALNKFSFYTLMFDYAMVINAGGWLLYIVYASIRQEVESRNRRMGYV